MTTARILLNRMSEISMAISEPKTAPKIAGSDSRRLNLKLETPFFLKPATANAH